MPMKFKEPASQVPKSTRDVAQKHVDESEVKFIVHSTFRSTHFELTIQKLELPPDLEMDINVDFDLDIMPQEEFEFVEGSSVHRFISLLICLLMNIGIPNQKSMTGNDSSIAIPGLVLNTPQPLELDNLDLDRPLAMRRVIRMRQIPARFGKLSDLLPSSQMAALSTYSQAITPQSSPTPSQASSPPDSRPPLPMPVDIPTPKPMIHKMTPNQFGLY